VNPVLIIGCGIILVGNLWFTYLAFRVSVIWGLGVLLVPFVSLMFLIRHWERARWAWWCALSGLLICLVQKAIHA